jgi:hypothetical protein
MLSSAAPAAELTGTVQTHGTVDGKEVIVVAMLKKAARCEDAESIRWGVEGRCPTRTLSSLRVSWGGVPALLPVSAYADLTALTGIQISPLGSGFAVTVLGGDAGTGYRAVLEFSRVAELPNPFITLRTVRTNEAPDDSWQRTEYHFNVGPEDPHPVHP